MITLSLDMAPMLGLFGLVADDFVRISEQAAALAAAPAAIVNMYATLGGPRWPCATGGVTSDTRPATCTVNTTTPTNSVPVGGSQARVFTNPRGTHQAVQRDAPYRGYSIFARKQGFKHQFRVGFVTRGSCLIDKPATGFMSNETPRRLYLVRPGLTPVTKVQRVTATFPRWTSEYRGGTSARLIRTSTAIISNPQTLPYGGPGGALGAIRNYVFISFHADVRCGAVCY